MNRQPYFDYIEERIETLASRIISRGKLNILDLNIHSEIFFQDFCNRVFGYDLVNMNLSNQNYEGIDLVDDKAKIVAQVSATCSKQKIESSLKKDELSKYSGYRYKFISIARDAGNLKNNTFNNPHNLLFDPPKDIIDKQVILNTVLNMPIDDMKSVYSFIKSELGAGLDIVKFDSNLASIINILASDDLVNDIDSPEINLYEIERKIDFNDLSSVKETIDDYKIYYHKVDEKYTEFDKAGSNKSHSVLQSIKREYLKAQNINTSSSDVFFDTISRVISIIEESANYKEKPIEELIMCVEILVVDAFVRCKIFKNPGGYIHVTAG